MPTLLSILQANSFHLNKIKLSSQKSCWIFVKRLLKKQIKKWSTFERNHSMMDSV